MFYCYYYHSPDIFFSFCFFQRQMISQDKLVKEVNDAKNAVEEYVYELREKLCGVYQKYINEEVNFKSISYCCSYIINTLWVTEGIY